MKTDVRTPMDVFHLPQHLVVPLFQRGYVWDEKDQWAPLWQDVRRIADLRLADPQSTATHFLGAVVVQAEGAQLGMISASNVIDGQQRLTTLQLLMDATAAVLDDAGLDMLVGQLSALTHNQDIYVRPGDTRLKIRHTNGDQFAFDEVMEAEPPVVHEALRHRSSRIARAHAFFSLEIAAWLGEATADEYRRRADALVSVLTRGLQLVVIDLTASENSQEIFETLNARGTPLTAADLIKNFVFQRLAIEGVDTKRAYAEDWVFDEKERGKGFWEEEVSVGRYLVSRSSLFFNQWLVSRTGEEISPQSTFTRFKSFIEHDTSRKMSELLPVLRQQAVQYRAWTEAANQPDRQLTPVEMAFYRMRAMDIEALKPLLLWLHAPERPLAEPVVNDVIAGAESWLVRRLLLRLSTGDFGRVVADVIRSFSDSPGELLGTLVRGYLARLNVLSTYWPDDAEVRAALAEEATYRRYPRGRLRMFLEAIENDYRGQSNQPQVPRRGYPIEHVLPQAWEANWPVDGPDAELARAAHVHRLGNLTLLTKTLNSKVSNGPWGGKREAFKEHDTLLLTSRLLKSSEGSVWDEGLIDDRTSVMTDALIRIWPIPADHAGIAIDRHDATTWVEVKHLLKAGLLNPGTTLSPRSGSYQLAEATISATGSIELRGKTFDTPSGAAREVRGGATNGWTFWRLENGRTLQDVRAAYRGEPTKPDQPAFDWSALHEVLERLPEGRWTTYGNLATVVGTAAQPLANHIAKCPQCTNPHRVLHSDGRKAEGFAWSDPNDQRDPLEMLREEGVAVEGGRASAERLLSTADIENLLDT